MTLDEAVALSLIENLPRIGLTARLIDSDPELQEIATSLVDRARAERSRAAAAGIHVLPWNDPLMPAHLLAISDLPPALWYRGSLDCLRQPAVAIVGSRAASSVAIETARRLATDLAARGITVVSGLARGVDSSAHRGALETGRTIAVLQHREPVGLSGRPQPDRALDLRRADAAAVDLCERASPAKVPRSTSAERSQPLAPDLGEGSRSRHADDSLYRLDFLLSGFCGLVVRQRAISVSISAGRVSDGGPQTALKCALWIRELSASSV